MASQTMSAPSSTNNIAQNTMATLVGDEDFGHGQSRESLKDIGTIDDHADTRDVTRVSEQVFLPVIPAPTVRPIATRPVDTPEIRRAAYEVTLSEKRSLSKSSITESGTDSSGQSTPSLKSPSAFEKGTVLPWDGYLMDSMPEKTQGHYVRNIRHQILSLYRRLFGIVFVANVSIFIAALACDTHQSNHLGLIVTANLFCAILMRQDYVINAFFKIFTSVPLSWPLTLRRISARVYHIGGLHSGCAVSGLLWLVLFTAQATHELTSGGPAGVLTVAISYCILLLLIVIVGLAYPHFRKVQHNKFEASHRFLGWTATALVWVQVISLNNDYRLPGQSLSYALVHSTPFWLVVVLTASIISPWLRLRKVPVRAVVLSQHAVRFYFDYVTPVSGSFTRVSTTPLTEWHGFATIAEPGKQGYSMIVSRAGDWTSSQIENPPTHIWVRGIPVCGVIHVVTMFRRILLVATGSGIAPCTPSILEQRVPIRLLWVSPNVRETFGDDFVDSLLEKSPDPVIYDTRKHGKPDMVKLTYRAARDFNAEAVCIISNEKLTKKVVYGLNSRGIPTFGAIWDS